MTTFRLPTGDIELEKVSDVAGGFVMFVLDRINVLGGMSMTLDELVNHDVFVTKDYGDREDDWWNTPRKYIADWIFKFDTKEYSTELSNDEFADLLKDGDIEWRKYKAKCAGIEPALMDGWL